MKYLYTNILTTSSGTVIEVALHCEEGTFFSNIRPPRGEVLPMAFTQKQAAEWPSPTTVGIQLRDFLKSLGENVYTPVYYRNSAALDSFRIFLQNWSDDRQWKLRVRPTWYCVTQHHAITEAGLSEMLVTMAIAEPMNRAMALAFLHQALLVEGRKEEQTSFDMEGVLEKRARYLSSDYFHNHKGNVTIYPQATRNREAIKVILDELADLYYF